jgi:hypothetical protein
MDIKSRRVSIHQEEMETILNLKSVLDHQESLESYAEKYCHLGWSLQAVNAQNGADLEVDFQAHPDTWVNRLWKAEWGETKINLGVRTGTGSRLLVLEVAKGPGEAILDQYGPWRAECIAALGADREQHFYAWDLPTCLAPAPSAVIPEIKWYGAGQVAPVPPTFASETQDTWRWLSPPWEQPPQSPSQALVRFFQQTCNREAQAHVQPGDPTSPGYVAGELFLEEAFSPGRESLAGSWRQPPDKARPSCFCKRPLEKPPQVQAALRQPFSCTRDREDLRKV